jgi:hypothetical protein
MQILFFKAKFTLEKKFSKFLSKKWQQLSQKKN